LIDIISFCRRLLASACVKQGREKEGKEKKRERSSIRGSLHLRNPSFPFPTIPSFLASKIEEGRGRGEKRKGKEGKEERGRQSFRKHLYSLFFTSFFLSMSEVWAATKACLRGGEKGEKEEREGEERKKGEEGVLLLSHPTSDIPCFSSHTTLTGPPSHW